VRKSLRIASATALALSLSMAGMSATAHADTSGLTASAIQSAVASPVSGFDLPSTSDGVTTTSTATAATVATVEGTTVAVPKSASNGVQLTTGGEQIGISLPTTSGTQTGTVTAPGIVAYPTTSGDVANAVQTDEAGAVRFLTVLKDADAPEEFQYNLDLPEGSSITKEDDGSLTVHTPTGAYTVSQPWAHDANGQHVWTQYFTDGESTIDLVVNHHGEDLAYPITADPWLSWGWTGVTVNYSRNETRAIAQGSLAAVGGYFGGSYGALFFLGAGGEFWSQYASRRSLCVSIWKSYYSNYYFRIWVHGC